jgi:hypothetical protein
MIVPKFRSALPYGGPYFSLPKGSSDVLRVLPP